MTGWALTIAAGTALALITMPTAWAQDAAGDPIVYGLLHQAELSSSGGAWAAAIESCRQVLAAEAATAAERMRAHLLMGDALRAQGQFAPAEVAYQAAFDLAQAPPAPHEPYRLAALEGLGAAQAQVTGDPAQARLAGIHERLAHPAVTLHVAPGGDDTAAGDEAHPLAGLEEAQRRVRALRVAGDLPPGGVTVYLRAGAYYRSAPLDLTAEDSGTAQAPVVYRAWPGESARLIGGRRIGGFGPVTDEAVLARLPEEARGQVLQTDLRAQGVTDLGVFRNAGYGIRAEPPAGLELFCDGRPMQLARWPNEGWARIAGLTDEEHPIYRGVPADRTGKFIYEGDRPLRWTDEPDLWLLGYWANPYAAGFSKVTSIDTNTRLIQTAEPYPPSGFCKGWPYFALNALAELDLPGEWYLDREHWLLYFWPPTPIEQAEVVVSEVTDPLVRMKDASHLVLVGLTLESTRGHGVEITGGEGNLVAACTIRNTGRWGAAIIGGADNGLLGCDLMDTGDGGVMLTGGDRNTLTACGNFVENCHIQRFGRWVRTHRVACQVRGVGIRLSHNVIHDGPTMAIMMSGNDNLIEFNDIHDVLHEASEGGAIYVGLDWTMRGNVIRHNIFHHIQKHCSPHATHGSRAIHIDDLFSGLNVYGNAFYRIADSAAIALGGGRDTLIENNVFADCHSAVSMGARGLGWAQHIVVEGGALRKKLAAVPYQEPPWSLRFPQLLTILQDDQPGAPKGNVIAHNVLSGGRWLESDAISLELADVRDNWTQGDAGFVDATAPDFRLREDSPVYGRIGFAAVPIERAGCYQDELRASWPIERTVGQYYRPGAAAQTSAGAPRPQYLVQRRLNEITIDGRVDEAEWTLDRDDFVPEMLIGQDPAGAKVDPPGRAWVLYDDQHLYVGLRAPVQPAGAIALGDAWGKNDAADVSLQAVGGTQPGPVFNLQGFAGGALKSTSDAGAPPDMARALLEATAYAATVRDDEWSAEWRIPWQAVGIDPATAETVRFSLGLRRLSGPNGQPVWMVWRGGGSTWNVETGGGDLVLRK